MSKQQQSKVYVPSTFGNVKTFSNGGEIINVDFVDAKALIEFIKKNSEDNKFRIEIQKQKNDPTKASVTLNTWKPKPQSGGISLNDSEDDSGDLPF